MQWLTHREKAKRDSEILMELARRLGQGDKFNYKNSEETFNELRVASRGSAADYYGITYERVEKNLGIFWPCPTEDHPGTPRLWEDKVFNTNDKKRISTQRLIKNQLKNQMKIILLC